MSTRHVASNAFGVLSGFLIIPAGLAGIFFTGAAKPAAAAAVNPCTAQLTVATRNVTPSLSPSPATTPMIPASTPASASPSTASSSPTSTPTSPSPTPTPSPTTSPSPSPSPSSSSPSPTDRLCISVQALATHVRAGAHARYAIWVSLASQTTGQAKISITAKPGKLAPSFTVCSPAGGTTCSVGLTAAQPVELQAAIAVPKNAAGTHITLTATGTSPQVAASASASGSVLVTAVPTPSPTPTPTPAGVGAPLPPGTVLPAEPPAGSLPLLPTPVTNPGLAFPKVSPGPHASTTRPPVPVTDVSASFPLDTRLIGDQILGLAVLAAAVTIAVARLSIRKQRPQHSRDPD